MVIVVKDIEMENSVVFTKTLSGRVQKLNSSFKVSEECYTNLVPYKEYKILVCLSVDVEDRGKKIEQNDKNGS